MKVLARTLAAAAALSAFAAAPAMAEAETFVFRVSQDQLSTQADAERAYQRLDEEARRYCRALDLSSISARADCRLDVLDNVVEAVGSDHLSAVHRDRQRTRTLAAAD